MSLRLSNSLLGTVGRKPIRSDGKSILTCQELKLTSMCLFRNLRTSGPSTVVRSWSLCHYSIALPLLKSDLRQGRVSHFTSNTPNQLLPSHNESVLSVTLRFHFQKPRKDMGGAARYRCDSYYDKMQQTHRTVHLQTESILLLQRINAGKPDFNSPPLSGRL